MSWTNRLEGKYNSKVWVLIDYSVPGSGVWSRATVTSVNAGSSGSTITAGGRGFWLQGNSGAYNQKVTVALSGVPAKYNWCAHVSDCPPNATASSGVYTLHGTPSFTFTAADGVTKQVVVGKTLAATALTIAPKTLTDATDCPGTFCPYTGSDLLIDATHACQLRTSGAKNWEAWIKDTRDNKIYRIAQLSTGLWTMDDYLNYKGHPAVVNELCSYADASGTEYWRNTIYANSGTPICPTGWRLPTQVEFERTITDWYQYLTKVYKNTGETVYISEGHVCQANGGYISFITNNCIQESSYGGRVSSINPVTYSNGTADRTCGSYIGTGRNYYRYSGYVRCVR